MNKLRLTLTTLGLLVICLVFSSITNAQVRRTFVAFDGKDSNTCDSLGRPCQSISAALTKVAEGGEVVILDSGNYQPLVIDKSVSIVAAPGVHPSISVANAGTGILVSADSGNSTSLGDLVVIRGLRVTSLGAGIGIDFQSAGALHVEGCEISGFNCPPPGNCGSGVGIRVDLTNMQISTFVVTDTTLRRNLLGIEVSGIKSALIEHCYFENNANGLMAGSKGGGNTKVTISNSIVEGSTGNGILAVHKTGDFGLSEIVVENCRVVGNSTGIMSQGDPNADPGTWIRVSNTTVTGNVRGLDYQSLNGLLSSRGNNTVEGNQTDGAFTDTFAAK